MISEKVIPNESIQRKLASRLGHILKECGAKIVETGLQDGYPVFEILPLSSGFVEKPKNIIFASKVKPDIRLSDAISNTVQVLTNRDKVLVYDRNITSNGVTWNDLQQWWKDTTETYSEEEAKKSLYERLKSCLPDESPPQRNFFIGYHRYFGREIPLLPALIPEVWLFWDPKTIKERGLNALKSLRMDFLLLLPGLVRVVVEIDGIHHYSNSRGDADVEQYTKLVSGDRDMKLLGYEIYRFSGGELQNMETCSSLVGNFFDRLFEKHGVSAISKTNP